MFIALWPHGSLLGGYDLCVMTAAPLPKRALPRPSSFAWKKNWSRHVRPRWKNSMKTFRPLGFLLKVCCLSVPFSEVKIQWGACTNQPTTWIRPAGFVFFANVRVKPWFGNSHFLGIEKMETDIFPRWWSNHGKWGYHNQRMSKLDDKPTGMELIIYKRSKHRLIKQDLTQCPCMSACPTIFPLFYQLQ